MNDKSQVTTLFIDLDDTVYPTSAGIWQLIQQRIFTYMEQVLGFPPAEVPTLRERLFTTYGTTLRGLQVEYHVSMQDYLDYVHDLDLSEYLSPNPELRVALEGYSQTKWIFTNASAGHARNVLNVMELKNIFDGIIDVTDVEPYCKPHPQAYQIALHLAGNPLPRQCLLVDDRWQNLAAARDLGFQVVLISDEPEPGYPTIQKLADLPIVFPQ
ncbi:MAG: pyrimidine 5'-nucleotidase [Anaerolineaceae bacterium]